MDFFCTGFSEVRLLEPPVYEPLKLPLAGCLEYVGVHGVDRAAAKTEVIAIRRAPTYREVGSRRSYGIALWAPPGGRVFGIANRVRGMALVVRAILSSGPACGKVDHGLHVRIRRVGVAIHRREKAAHTTVRTGRTRSESAPPVHVAILSSCGMPRSGDYLNSSWERLQISGRCALYRAVVSLHVRYRHGLTIPVKLRYPVACFVGFLRAGGVVVS